MAGGRRTPTASWWAKELERLKPALRSRLRRRGFEWVADEVLSNIGLELTKLFAAGVSQPGNTQELERLIWRMVRFRASDELRARFRRRLSETQTGTTDEIADPSLGEDQLVQDVDARAFLLELIEGLERLTPQDRALLTRPLDEEDVRPLSGSERVRVLRLRRQLVNDVSARLRGGKNSE